MSRAGIDRFARSVSSRLLRLTLILSAALLSLYEAKAPSAVLRRNVVEIAALATPLLPAVTATAVFLGGLILLISGALPAEPDRLSTLRAVLPLPFVEASHFFASVIGSLLLIVAHGLLGRLRTAWFAAIVLLLARCHFLHREGRRLRRGNHLLVGRHVLLIGRRHFYRRGGILSGHTSNFRDPGDTNGLRNLIVARLRCLS